MYSNVHGNIGAITFVATFTATDSILLASFSAFFSHYVLDFLGEKGYANIKETLQWEVIPFLVFFITAYLSDVFWFAILGHVLGNLMDLIDKKMYLSVFYPKKYPATFYFHKWKVLIPFNSEQTKLSTIIASASFVIYIFLR